MNLSRTMEELDDQIFPIIFAVILLGGLMSTFIIAMVFIHRNRQSLNRQKLEQVKSEYEKTLLNIENEIQQETLSHIGRELHDNIGQLLSLAKLNFGSIKPQKHEEGKEILNMVIQEVRNLSKQLNIDWVESISIKDFAAQQLERINATDFCSTTLEASIELGDLIKEHKLVLIRVIQEALNNAIKHASPKNITIKIYEETEKRKIEIIDDGKGFDLSGNQTTGSGMTNLKKRMETIGGEFIINSASGIGTQIILTLPL